MAQEDTKTILKSPHLYLTMCQVLLEVLYVYKLFKCLQQPIKQLLLFVVVAIFPMMKLSQRCRYFKVTAYIMEPDIQLQPDS